MDGKVKEKWVAALRGGEFKQTYGVLRRTQAEVGRPAGHCCLGVLCELYSRESGAQWENTNGCGFLGCIGVLPPEVVKWAGLVYSTDYEDNPRVYFEGRRTTLAHLNDQHVPFSTIAVIIEEQL